MSLPNHLAHLRSLKFVAALIVLFSFCFGTAACRQKAGDPVGLWRGTVKNPSGEVVQFTLEVKREGDQLIGSLLNGDERTTSTSGSFDGRALRLRYDFYDAELVGVIEGETLRGSFDRQWKKQILKRELVAQHVAPTAAKSIAVPCNTTSDVNGEWVLRVEGASKPSLWRASFKQQGCEVGGTIIPVSGDWGQIAGGFEDGRLILNRFDGINSRVVSLKPAAGGKLEGEVDLGLADPKRKLTAERLDADNKELVASLPDPGNYTRMSNPAEPLRFSFPDLSGKTVSSTDKRFKNKVLIVSITGSWCPNCHEESPLLQDFYQRFHSEGLEVIALGFEYTGEPKRDLEQLKIFADRHHLTYPVLLAGSTEEGEIARKLPQLVSFGGYPTTIFIGRDGQVKHIHTGFEGKAAGERHRKLVKDYEELVKQLLAANEA